MQMSCSEPSRGLGFDCFACFLHHEKSCRLQPQSWRTEPYCQMPAGQPLLLQQRKRNKKSIRKYRACTHAVSFSYSVIKEIPTSVGSLHPDCVTYIKTDIHRRSVQHNEIRTRSATPMSHCSFTSSLTSNQPNRGGKLGNQDCLAYNSSSTARKQMPRRAYSFYLFNANRVQLIN